MTRQPHDQFAKSFLSEFLDPWGNVQVSREVSDEPRWIDLYFEPDPQQDPSPLGLLGRMAQTPCLLEPYRTPVTDAQIRACLLKGLMVRAQRERDNFEGEHPKFWILTPTASQKLLARFRAQPEEGWSQGIYHLAVGLLGAVVVIHQLPRHRDTLWLRLLGRGRVQHQAIQEVLEMKVDDPERVKVLELLGNWKILLDQKREALIEEERELLMNLSPAYLKWKEETLNQGIRIGERQGERRGIQLGEQELALRLLRRKVGSISPHLETQIRALPIDHLETLGEALLDFGSLTDLTDWLETHEHPVEDSGCGDSPTP